MTSPSVTAVSPGPENHTSIEGVAEPDAQFAVEWQVSECTQSFPSPATVEGTELS